MSGAQLPASIGLERLSPLPILANLVEQKLRPDFIFVTTDAEPATVPDRNLAEEGPRPT